METIKDDDARPENNDYSLASILSPAQCALLVIDMQNDFLSPEGFFATRTGIPGSVDQMQSTVPYIQDLISAAHNAAVPVIFTLGYEDVRFRQGPDLRRAAKWQESDAEPEGINSKYGSWGAEFYDGITPTAEDIVIEKYKWSAFSGRAVDGRDLNAILNELGRGTLVVTGVVAETCVETTVRDAYNRNYCVVVPDHSVGSNREDQLKARMQYWALGFVGDVLDEEEIKSFWYGTAHGD